ncbi:MAG: hypothetical protein GQ582_08055 [Methyloprofundus sp.]|nr:hypothetical protein [Methyloprofundus sp.]
MKKIVCLSFCLFAGAASAVQVDFTGGTVYDGSGSIIGVTDTTANFTGAYYEEAGFRLEFLSGGTFDNGSFGDYYNTGNDVIHGHWGANDVHSGPFGNLDQIKISKIDGSTFDLGGFRVSTNTAVGGGPADGNELTWVNSSKANEIFTVTSDDWGLGSGPDPLITIAAGNSLFDDILWFSFTNDALSSAVGLGLDNFFLDEEGDEGGTDPTVPAPTAIYLLGLGLAGLLRMKKVAVI